MSNERNLTRVPKECKGCVQFADVHNPVRLYHIFASMLDKIEDKVMNEEFKPATSDLLRVWDAVQSMDAENRSSEEGTIRWVDPEAVKN